MDFLGEELNSSLSTEYDPKSEQLLECSCNSDNSESNQNPENASAKVAVVQEESIRDKRVRQARNRLPAADAYFSMLEMLGSE